MSSSSVSHSSKWSERDTIAIMANCKKAYNWVRERDEAIAKTIQTVEAAILKDPSDILKTLLLQVLENHGRDKCVATYQQITDTKTREGVAIWETKSIDRLIENNGEWVVSVVRGGTGIRVHRSAAESALLKADLDEMVENQPLKYRNVRVY